MPSLKDVRDRISSVKSTQQLTKAMKMVAAAKLRRAQNAIEAIRPYNSKLNEILFRVSMAQSSEVDNPYGEVREVNNALVVVVTSDRGLCGAFNMNAIKAGLNAVNERFAHLPKENITILPIGKKGLDYFSRRGDINQKFSGTMQKLNFDVAKKAAEFIMDSFVNGNYDEVVVVYNEFKNVATQVVRTASFLPLVPDDEEKDNETNATNTDYIFEPSAEFILTEAIPKSIKMKFYTYLLESNASEQGARMTAMENATENAGELLKDLNLQYNRSRQAAITKEILEIVGGAEALAQNS